MWVLLILTFYLLKEITNKKVYWYQYGNVDPKNIVLKLKIILSAINNK